MCEIDMHHQKSKIFKRPKNREDGSDFIFGPKKSQRRKLFDKKNSNDRNDHFFVPEKFKNYRIKNRKILKIDIAGVINY